MRKRQPLLPFSMMACAASIVCVTFFLLLAPVGCSALSQEERAAAQRLLDALKLVNKEEGEVDLDVLDEDVRLLFGGKEPEISRDPPRNDKGEKIFYADRLVRDMLEASQDPDCMSRDLDASSPDFDVEEAAKIYQKCRLLVIRNVFSPDVLEPYKRKVASFLYGIQSGRVSAAGKTSFGDNHYFYDTAPGRWDMAFPKELADPEVLAHDIILDVLQNDRVLGDKMNILDFGGIIAEPGAPQQKWHSDGEIYSGAFHHTGMGGHDLPPFNVGIIAPLLNMTAQHGPTEFCLGSTNFACIHDDFYELDFQNKTLEDIYYEQFSDYMVEGLCPANMWRAPLLNFGDVLFFAFDIVHRGGPNNSDDLRFILYNTYARSFFRDPDNFIYSERLSYTTADGSAKKRKMTPEQQQLEYLLKRARLGIPDEIKPEDPQVIADRPLDSLEKMGIFRSPEIHKERSKTSSSDSREVAVPLTNVNVDIPGLLFCTKSKKSGEEDCDEFDFEVGETELVDMSKGDVLRLLSPSPTSSSGLEGRKTLFAWELKKIPAHSVILHTDFFIDGPTVAAKAG